MAKKSNSMEIQGIFNELKETAKETVIEDTKIIEDAPIQEVKNEKKKNRSFMLPESTIKKLKELNFILDKDLSSIVTDAVELYYNQNKDKIEETLK